MEEQTKISAFLEHILQPGFLVDSGRIIYTNQAAQAMLIQPGIVLEDLLQTGIEEYASFQEGQLWLTLQISGRCHNASVERTDAGDLVLLEDQEDMDQFRSMALAAATMRMPLMQAITSASQLFTEQPQTEPAAAKMNRSLMQMLRTVCNMADISRYAASTRMETRDVDSFLLELFQKAQALTEDSIQISFNGLQHPVFSRIDPEQLERAVWNILSNSIKFMPQGGSICATLTRSGNTLRLTVEDNGSGIPEDVRPSLFRRYLRQPGIEDHRYGIGLGLAMIRTVAANHGGTLLISSAPAGGTRIAMTMAIRQEDGNSLHSPIFRPDYTGGFDHALVELSDCLNPSCYKD